MKFIFDFDDVLFYNSLKFKPHMFRELTLCGIPEKLAREYYVQVRHKFSCKDYVNELFKQVNITGIDPTQVYENIMKECSNFVNLKMKELALMAGKNNCYIVTHGVHEYQLEKIVRSGLGQF